MTGLSRNASWFFLSPVLWFVFLYHSVPAGFSSIRRHSLITLTTSLLLTCFFSSFSISIFSCFVFCLYAMPRRSLWTPSCLQERWVSAAFLSLSFFSLFTLLNVVFALFFSCFFVIIIIFYLFAYCAGYWVRFFSIFNFNSIRYWFSLEYFQ